MQKEFNHNSFKKAASNVSGFLKEKDIDIPYITLLNALSLFLGAKNWNTLKEELDKKDKSVILEKKANPSSLYFDERLKGFLECICSEEVYDNFKGYWPVSYSIYSNFEDYKNRVLSCAEKILKEDNNLELFNLIEMDNLLAVERDFEVNSSLLDEERFDIQIAQKGNNIFNSNYLDIFFFLYAIESKWFEKYVMGKIRYSYIYDRRTNKEVFKISLPIDSFCVSDFRNEANQLCTFMTLFYYGKLKFDCNLVPKDTGYSHGAYNALVSVTEHVKSL